MALGHLTQCFFRFSDPDGKKLTPIPKNAIVTKLFAPKFCAECTDREVHSSHGDHFREDFCVYVSGTIFHGALRVALVTFECCMALVTFECLSGLRGSGGWLYRLGSKQLGVHVLDAQASLKLKCHQSNPKTGFGDL